jgi:glycosyltransferase involved in cell wall biosynthesis
MIEPLLLGKPAVVTRVGVGLELEADHQAIVVSPDSLPEFIDGLRRVMAPNIELAKISATGPAYVRSNYDLHRIADQLIGLYRGEHAPASPPRAVGARA